MGPPPPHRKFLATVRRAPSCSLTLSASGQVSNLEGLISAPPIERALPSPTSPCVDPTPIEVFPSRFLEPSPNFRSSSHPPLASPYAQRATSSFRRCVRSRVLAFKNSPQENGILDLQQLFPVTNNERSVPCSPFKRWSVKRQ